MHVFSSQFLFLVILRGVHYSCALVQMDWMSSTHLQIKDSLFKRSYLKTGIYPRKITFYSLTHFIRKLGHRLPSYRTTFIWQKCCFVITARLASINKLAWNYQIIHQEPLPFRELCLVSKAYLALYSNFPALFDYSIL